jgi:hypothetical protein
MFTIDDVLTRVPEIRRKSVLHYKCPTLSKRLNITVPNYISAYLLSVGVNPYDVEREIFDHWHKAMLYTNAEQDVQGTMLCFEYLTFSKYDTRISLHKSVVSKDPWNTVSVKEIGCKKDIDVRRVLINSLLVKYSPKEVKKCIDLHTEECRVALIDEGIRSGSASVYCPGRKILSRVVESRMLASLLSEKTRSTKIKFTP